MDALRPESSGPALQQAHDESHHDWKPILELSIRCRHLEARTCLQCACLLISQGRAMAAMGCLEAALSIEHHNAEAFFALGVIAQSRNQTDRAIRYYRSALGRNPGHHQTINNLAVTYKQKGDLEAAIVLYNSILAEQPDFLDAWLNLGNALRLTGRHTQATACYETALTHDPICINAWLGLALNKRDSGLTEQALEALQTTLRLQSNHVQALNEVGLLWQDKGQFRSALEYIIKAHNHEPDNPEIISNLIRLLHRCGWVQDAIQVGRSALERGMELPELLSNLALAELSAGDYTNGLKHYESRFHLRQLPVRPLAVPPCPRWDGRPLAPGQQLLLISEQGLGDTLQFIRYAKTLRERGLSVLISAPDTLHRLIQNSDLAAQILSPAEAGHFNNGYWLPLLSLPLLLGVTPLRPIVQRPYLKAGSETSRRWQERLAAEQHPIIALNWHGNVRHDANSLSKRFFDLEQLAPALNNALQAGHPFRLLSLQKGAGSEQLADCSFRHLFVNCQPEIDACWDFDDIAAIASHCQLVISCDSAPVHLAAGIGRPTWLLLPKQPDWRWGIAGNTSFWYPSLLLFRQSTDGSWLNAVTDMGQQLLQFLAAQKPHALHTPAALGELIDKITILSIKADQLTGIAKINATQELSELKDIFECLPFTVSTDLISELATINCTLWVIEARLRTKELNRSYDSEFTALARSVYLYNDKRAAIKRLINSSYGSALIEEKSYR